MFFNFCVPLRLLNPLTAAKYPTLVPSTLSPKTLVRSRKDWLIVSPTCRCWDTGVTTKKNDCCGLLQVLGPRCTDLNRDNFGLLEMLGLGYSDLLGRVCNQCEWVPSCSARAALLLPLHYCGDPYYSGPKGGCTR